MKKEKIVATFTLATVFGGMMFIGGFFCFFVCGIDNLFEQPAELLKASSAFGLFCGVPTALITLVIPKKVAKWVNFCLKQAEEE